MKRLFLLGLLLSVGCMYAAQLTEAEAYRIAQKYNASLAAIPWKQKASGVVEVPSNAEYYVFNASDNRGFVIVSGDDSLTELVGYSDSGTIDMDNLPPNLSSWLDAYAEYVRAVRRSEAKPLKTIPLVSLPIVRPLLKEINWNQGVPYNDMCPYDEKAGARCPAGCMVTSFAQVMKYWEWPDTGVGSHSYQSAYGELSANFAKNYDWSKLRDSYNGYYDGEGNWVKDWTDEEGQAIAQFMYDLGVAVEMSYTPTGSGASVKASEYALRNYFKYDADYYQRGEFSTSEFVELIVSELQESRPVVMAGYNLDYGHAFVLDGCNPDGFFHVNWGWGGMSNGYFNVNYLSPSEQGIGGSDDGYYLSQEILVMQPYYEGDVLPEKQAHLKYVVQDNYPVAGLWTDVTSFDKSEPLAFKIYGLYNDSGRDYIGKVRTCVSNWAGETVTTGTVPFEINALPSGYLYTEIDATVMSPDFSQLPDGRYSLILESLENGYDEWISFSSRSSIILEVSGSQVNIIPEEIKLEMSQPIEGPTEVYMEQNVVMKVTVDNKGNQTLSGSLELYAMSAEGGSPVLLTAKKLDLFDNVSYETELSFEVSAGNFIIGKSYDCYLSFKTNGGKILKITTELAPFRFTVMEGEPPRVQLALGYYDTPEGIKGGIFVENKKLSLGLTQDIMMRNLTNYNDDLVVFDIGIALYDASGHMQQIYNMVSDVELGSMIYLPEVLCERGFCALDNYEDGRYYFEALTREKYEGVQYDWIPMMHTSRIYVQKSGDWVYVYDPLNYLKVKGMSFVGDPVQATEATVVVDLENMGSTATSGVLEYKVYEKGNSATSIVYGTVDVNVDIEGQIKIPFELSMDKFVVGQEYEIEIAGYADNTDAGKTFVGQVLPFVVLDVSGLESTTVTSAVYPNPVVERVTITAASEITSVELYSIGGNLLLTVPADGQMSQTIDLNTVPAGVYVMMVYTPNGVESHRIMKK